MRRRPRALEGQGGLGHERSWIRVARIEVVHDPVGMHAPVMRQLGRREAPGSPFEYGTTWEFLECFGLTSLGALPSVLSPEGVRNDEAMRVE